MVDRVIKHCSTFIWNGFEEMYVVGVSLVEQRRQ